MIIKKIFMSLILAISLLALAFVFVSAQTTMLPPFPEIQGDVFQITNEPEGRIFWRVNPVTGEAEQRGGPYAEIDFFNRMITTIAGTNYFQPGDSLTGEDKLYVIDILSGSLVLDAIVNRNFVSLEADKDILYGLTTAQRELLRFEIISNTLTSTVITQLPASDILLFGISAFDPGNQMFYNAEKYYPPPGTLELESILKFDVQSGVFTRTAITYTVFDMAYRSSDDRLVGLIREAGPGTFGSLQFIWSFAVIDPETGLLDSQMPLTSTDFLAGIQGAGGLDGAETYIFPGFDADLNRRLYAIDKAGVFYTSPIQQRRSGQALGQLQGFEIAPRRVLYLPLVFR